MKRLVLDTNVLVSAVLTPAGTCARVVNLTLLGDAVLLVDARILAEWQAVLRRPRFHLPADAVEAFLAALDAVAEPVAAAPLQHAWPDLADAQFAEVAVAGRADLLVTGNKRHFPEKWLADVRVVTAAEALTVW